MRVTARSLLAGGRLPGPLKPVQVYVGCLSLSFGCVPLRNDFNEPVIQLLDLPAAPRRRRRARARAARAARAASTAKAEAAQAAATAKAAKRPQLSLSPRFPACGGRGHCQPSPSPQPSFLTSREVTLVKVRGGKKKTARLRRQIVSLFLRRTFTGRRLSVFRQTTVASPLMPVLPSLRLH